MTYCKAGRVSETKNLEYVQKYMLSVCGDWSGAFIASGGEPSVGANIMDMTYRIQGWNFVHGQPPDLNRGLLICHLLL